MGVIKMLDCYMTTGFPPRSLILFILEFKLTKLNTVLMIYHFRASKISVGSKYITVSRRIF